MGDVDVVCDWNHSMLFCCCSELETPGDLDYVDQ